jgi:hypothetical protein
MVHEVDFSGRGVLHTLADGNQAEPEEKIVAMVNPFSKSSEHRTPPLEQEISLHRSSASADERCRLEGSVRDGMRDSKPVSAVGFAKHIPA